MWRCSAVSYTHLDVYKRQELSRRAEKSATQRGLKVGTQEYYEYCKKYVDPRNIPPSVIELSLIHI